MEIKTKILNIFKTKESVTLSFPIENKGETTKTSSVKGQLSIEGQVKELFFILDTTLNDRLKLDLTPALNQITTKRGYRVYLFVYKENKCRRKVTNGNCIPVYLTAPNNDKYFVGEAYPDGSLWLALGFLRNDFEYGSELRIIEPRADNSYASGQVRVYKTNIDLDFNSFLNQLRNLE
jgi:hypothetical protein